MDTRINNIKVAVLTLFVIGLAIMFSYSTFFKAEASTGGSPAGHTGAPGETTCTSCHNGGTNTGAFNIVAPSSYVPGQTYTIQVQHTTTDTSRTVWGFEAIPLTSGNAMGGTLANLNANTRIRISGTKSYVTQTSAGAFSGQTLSANWSFSWTAPATNVGNVTLYAAGLQGDNSGDESGDQTYVRSVVIPASTTAAMVQVSGRVLSPEGRGVTNAQVTITDSNGFRQTTTTTRRGLYVFTNVQAGFTYVIDVSSRRFLFESRVVEVNDDLIGIDFVGGAKHVEGFTPVSCTRSTLP